MELHQSVTQGEPLLRLDPRDFEVAVARAKAALAAAEAAALVAEREDGLRLYRFQYLWSDQVWVGVMAQDLLEDARHREAVVTTQSGYYAVDYRALGLQMETLEAWQAKQQAQAHR